MAAAFMAACDAFDALPQESVIAGCFALFAILAVTDRVLAHRWST